MSAEKSIRQTLYWRSIWVLKYVARFFELITFRKLDFVIEIFTVPVLLCAALISRYRESASTWAWVRCR